MRTAAQKASTHFHKILEKMPLLDGLTTQRTIYLKNLPDWKRWATLLSSEAKLTIKGSVDKPTGFRLDLITFSRSHDPFGQVFGKGHPLENVLTVDVFKPGPDKEIIGYVDYFIIPSSCSPTGSDVILSPCEREKNPEAVRIGFEMTAP